MCFGRLSLLVVLLLWLGSPAWAEQKDTSAIDFFLGTDPLLPIVEALFYSEPSAAFNIVSVWRGTTGWDLIADLNFLAQDRLLSCIAILGVRYHPFTGIYSGVTLGLNVWGWPTDLTDNSGRLESGSWALSMGTFPLVGFHFLLGDTILVGLETGVQFSFAEWSLFNKSTVPASSLGMLRPALNVVVKLADFTCCLEP